MRIVFTGGGTGGHLYPIIAIAREIRRIAEEERILGLRLYYIGPDAVPAELARAEEIIAGRITAGKIRRYFSFKNFLDIFWVFWSLGQALLKMFLVMPDVVFIKGGYGSFPVALAARLYRIPAMVHESDAVPGRVNRWAGKWARRVAISFTSAQAQFPSARTALTGVPIRKRLAGANRDQSREVLGVYSDRPALLILGGSQGALAINRAVIEILPSLLAEYELIHQTGELNYDDLRFETAPLIAKGLEHYYHLTPFLKEEELAAAYAIADLVISRAGGTTIFELASSAKPSILVPIKIAAQDHQRQNAYAYAAGGAAIVLEEDNLTPSLLLHEIKTLVADPARRAKMAEAAKAFAKPGAAAVIAQELLTLGLH